MYTFYFLVVWWMCSSTLWLYGDAFVSCLGLYLWLLNLIGNSFLQTTQEFESIWTMYQVIIEIMTPSYSVAASIQFLHSTTYSIIGEQLIVKAGYYCFIFLTYQTMQTWGFDFFLESGISFPPQTPKFLHVRHPCFMCFYEVPFYVFSNWPSILFVN